MKSSRLIVVLVFVTIGFIGVNFHAHAYALRFEVRQVHESTDKSEIAVYLRSDSAETSLNALEGRIAIMDGIPPTLKNFDGEISVRTGNSSLTRFIEEPHVIRQGSVIRFAGGNEQSIISTPRDAYLISIILKKNASASLHTSIILLDAMGYKGDGSGEPVALTARTITLNHTKAQEPTPSVSIDTEKPYFETLLITRDSHLSDGKWVLLVSGRDDASGIDHITIEEGDARTLSTSTMYVLKDQDRTTSLQVTITDRSGNSFTTTILTPREKRTRVLMGAVVFLCILLGLRYSRKLRQNR